MKTPADGLRAAGPVVLAVIAVGGSIGALGRYGVGLLLPPDSFPWATVGVNVVGGFLLGLLVAVTARPRYRYPLVRSFVGTGVLGGFTTFSTYSTDSVRLLEAGRYGSALGYSALTLFAALLATAAGLLIGAQRSSE